MPATTAVTGANNGLLAPPVAPAQATPEKVGATAQTSLGFPPCVGGMAVFGLAAMLPLWIRRGTRRL